MLSDPLLGRVIDNKYRIDAEIGAGGMATIYRATRLKIGDVVAIKILHTELLREPKFAERFQREAQAAAGLKHPNVVTVHDFGVSDDGIIYLVMELVEGRNLRTIIKDEGPMPATTAAEITRQVCAALTEAHRHNTIHRDIKPANIAVTATDDGLRVKVLDFGIASLRGGTMMTFTQTGAVLGTPAYMSPEQCLGEELDGRSDIYSLGVVLFEMLAGVVPFNSPTATAVVMQHVQQAPPPLRVLNVSISPAVEAVVLRALAKRREDRQQSPKQLADELSAAVSGASVPLAGDGGRGLAGEPLSATQAAFTMVQSPFHPQAPTPVPAHRGQGRGVLIGLAAAAVVVAMGFGVQRMWSERAPATRVARPTATTVPRARVSYSPPTVRSVAVPVRPAAMPPQPTFAPDAYRNAVGFVNEYYRLWNAGQYPVMYGMLSARMQVKNPYAQYVKYHSLVTRIDVQSTPGYAPEIVNVHIVSHDREKDGSITENVNEGRWLLTIENGELKLNAQDAHEVKPTTVFVAPIAPDLTSATSVNFVQEYYRLWNAREYGTMYGMLSVDMQRTHPYNNYVKYHSLVVRIDVDATPTYSPSVVGVRIISYDREKDGSITRSINEGQWYLTMQNGALKLDAQKLHEVN